jgi:hypothetical protein
MTIKRLKSLCSILFVVGFIFVGIPALAAEKTIGVIMTGGIPYYKDLHKAFAESLASQGFGPGRVRSCCRPLP